MHSVFTPAACMCRVFKQHLEQSWRQLSKSWVRRTFLFSSSVPLIHLLFSVSFQFIFFFQIPWLPEVLLSLQDYQFLEDLFTSKRSVILELPLLLSCFPSLLLSLSHYLPLSLPLSTGSEEQGLIPTRCSGGLQVHLLQPRSSHWTHQLLSLHVLLP